MSRFDGRPFGGTVTALSVVALERTSGREARWVTAQFVATAELGSRISIATEHLARSRRISQLRLTATTCGGEIAFVAVGAAADRRHRARGGRTVPFDANRGEPAPLARAAALQGDGPVGWQNVLETRLAAVGVGGDESRICLWSRFRDDQPLTAALLAFAADVIPLSVSRACGLTGSVSLDNTVRLLRVIDTEWVLIDLHPHGAWQSHGTGIALLWASDGTLLSTAIPERNALDDRDHRGLRGRDRPARQRLPTTAIRRRQPVTRSSWLKDEVSGSDDIAVERTVRQVRSAQRPRPCLDSIRASTLMSTTS